MITVYELAEFLHEVPKHKIAGKGLFKKCPSFWTFGPRRTGRRMGGRTG
jgi:hypothetical protein